MIEHGDDIMLRKIGAVEDPEVPTPSKEEHLPGRPNPGQSLPVDYEVEGQLLGKVEPGYMLAVKRQSRNGVEKDGILRTSPLESVEEKENYLAIETQNSIYHLLPRRK